VALKYAALEAFGGRYNTTELELIFDPDAVKQEALDLIFTIL